MVVEVEKGEERGRGINVVEFPVFGQSKAKKNVKTWKVRAVPRFQACILRGADVSPDAGTDQAQSRFSHAAGVQSHGT